jgi:5-methylcytosine-specific restriction endonuclease McrA
MGRSKNSNKGRKRIRRNNRIIDRDRKFSGFGPYWLCYLCNRELNRSQITIDHIQPLSRGGTNAPENMIVCCEECNSDKGNSTLGEYFDRTGRSPVQDIQKANDNYHDFKK